MHERAPRVAFVSLGCRVNRVETDVVASELLHAGCVVTDERKADAVVINTCAVTGEAEAKTRKAVRHAAGLPGRPVVVATGCVATLFSDELATLGENVCVELDKAQVAQRVLDELEVRGFVRAHDADMSTATAVADLDGLGFAADGGPVTPTGRTRPGIKVQDGCDLRCTYCIVWKARGASRSVQPDEVLRQVREECAHGASEVMLTGINLGRYRAAGSHGVLRLPDLLELVLEKTEVGRVRLGSIEPQDVDGRLAQVIAASEGRVAPFLHMCLQSGCDDTLRRMGRVYDTALFAERMAVVREVVPHASLGTDLIVGFPGETDEEFERSLAFCREARFSRMHVFKFSPRPGTPAATMEGQVSAMVAGMRSNRMRKLASKMRLAEAHALVGARDLVVVQAPGVGVSGGLFDVQLDAEARVGSLVPVRVTSVRDDATLVCSMG